MRFAEIPGNEGVKRALVGMVDSGKIPHAILFHEDDGCGAVAMCNAFLQYLMCRDREGGDSCGACPSCNKIAKMIHPDVHFVYPVSGGSLIPSSAKPTALSYVKEWRALVLGNPWFTERDLSEALGIEGKSSLIAVAEAREILDRLSFHSLEGGWRAIVVYLPEKMNAEAANRLLKSIEEPPEQTLFLLVTHAPERVLPTISSRCQLIRLMPVRRSLQAESAEEAQNRELVDALLSAIIARDLSAALETGEEIAALPSRERLKSFLGAVSRELRTVFLVQQGLSQLADVPQEQAARIGHYATSLKRSYVRLALPHLDRSAMLIDRNGNAKIVVCDLVNKLFVL